MVNETSADPGSGDTAGPPSATPRRWTLTTIDGATIHGHLPGWAGADPSEHNVPTNELADRLADIHHTVRFPGQTLPVYTAAARTGKSVEQEILSCSVDCTPYAKDPEPRAPVANLHLCEENWIPDLDPDGLARVADHFRAQADRIDHQILPMLVAACEDWNINGGTVLGRSDE
ncbi:DUF6907 domain-containing protein [Streptomyces sp. NPDC087270]|uniref:DUF6907 domain-containing protein n=1 Tax=Streptomyces sp. NPDC087270 TaxID=3365774 RepID=UPI0037FA5A1A